MAELFEGSFEVFDDFLGQNVGIGQVVGFFEVSSRSQKMSRLALSRLQTNLLCSSRPERL